MEKSCGGLKPVLLETFPFESDPDDDDELERVGGNESESDFTKPTVPPSHRSGKSPKNRIYYRCDKCSYQTEIQGLLDRHIAKHAMDWPFHCSVCDFSDYDHSAFVDHWVAHQHTKVIRCAFCSFKCNHPNSLKTHIPKHRPVEMLDCSMCEFSSNYVSSMKNHIEAYHTKLYPCEQCQEPMTKHDLIEHCEKVHGAEPMQKSADRSMTDLQIKQNYEHHKAVPSNRTPKTEDSLEIKPVVVRKPSKSGCGATGHYNCNCTPAEPDELIGSPKADSDLALKCEIDEFKCSLCAFTAMNHLSLRYHGVVFHKKKVSCDYCSAVMTKHDMIQHALKEHGVEIGARPVVKSDTVSTDSKESPCSGVEEAVTSLVRGIPDFTRTAKRFKCAHCGYSANRRSSLDSHVLRLHTNKHVCGYCSVVLTKHELIEHCKNVHRVACSIYGVKQSHLKEVGLDQKDRIAEEPDEFDGRDVDEVHYSSAEDTSVSAGNAKVFKCSFCEYFASRNAHLDSHVFRHHTVKFYCNHCSAIMTKHELIEHCQNVHGLTIKASQRNFKEAKLCTEDKKGVRNSGGSEASSTMDQQLSECSKTVTRKFTCAVCNFSSSSKYGLKKHKEHLHKKKYSCKHCKVVMTKYCLMLHSKKEHGVVMKLSGVASLRKALRQRVGLSRKYVELKKPSSPLTKHVRHRGTTADQEVSKGTSGKTFDCLICPYSSFLVANLERHVLTYHTKKYTCKQCSAVMSKHELIKHLKSAHGVNIKHVGGRSLGGIADNLNGSEQLDDDLSESSAISQADKNHEMSYQKCLPFTSVSSKMTANPKSQKSQNGPCASASLAAQEPSLNSESQSKLLQCHDCSYKTKIKSLMRRHVLIHLPEGQFACNKCDFRENRTAAFAKHVRSHSESNGSFECCFCSFSTIFSRDFKEHFNIHRAIGSYYCPKCRFSCSFKRSLKRHIQTRHEEKPTAGTKSWVSQHMKKRHPSLESRPLRLKSKPPQKQGRRRLGSASVSSNIKRNMAAKKTSSCQIKQHFGETVNVELLQCNACEYQTAREDLLRRHEAKHAPVECPICGLEFSKGYSFAVHLSKHNPPQSPYKCFYCGRFSKSIGNLCIHLSSHVEALKKQDCPICEFSSIRQDRLRAHLETHGYSDDGVKQSGDILKVVPLKSGAPNLKSRSSTKKELPLKIGVSIGDPGQELLRCKTCEYQTAREDLLLRHETKHAPVECPICGVELNDGYAFAVHLSKHNTPASRYKCFYCKYVGKSVPDLYVHLSSHMDALKKRDCSECEFSCLLPSSLERHLATHSKKNSTRIQKFIESDAGISPERKIEEYPIRPSVEVGLECSAITPGQPGTEPIAEPSRSDNTSEGGNQSVAHPDIMIQKIYSQTSESSNKVGTPKLPEKITTVDSFPVTSSGHTRALSIPKPKLQCHRCSYETKMKSLMRRHVKLHLPEGQYVCPKCDEFRTCESRVFVKHLVSHDPSGTLYKCCFCSFSTSSSGSFDQHIKLHRPVRERFCSKCEFAAVQCHALDRHYKAYHVKKYVCRKCPKVATRFKLSQHFKKCHSTCNVKRHGKLCTSQSQLTQKRVDKGSFSSNLKERIAARKAFRCRIKHVDGETSERELLSCKTCEFQTARKKLLFLHEAEHISSASHGNSECGSPEVSSKPLIRWSLYSDVEFTAAWGLQCQDCDFRTMREDLFERHVTKHKPLICPVCSYSIADHSQFAAHLAKHNPPSTPFKCHYCDHFSKNRTHLSYHLAIHVNALKKFDCPLCEFSSNRADTLGTHFGVHRSSKSQTPTASLKFSNDSPVPLNSGTSSAHDSFVVPLATTNNTPYDGVSDSHGTISLTQPPSNTTPSASTSEMPAPAEKSLTWSDFTNLFHQSQ